MINNSSRMLLQEAFLLHERLLTSSSTCQGSLGLEQAVHLFPALRSASVKGTLHPITLWLQGVTVLLLVLLHGKGRCLLLSCIRNLLICLCLHALKSHLLCLEVIEHLCCRCTLPFKLFLRCGFCLLASCDLIVKVLLDVPHD